MLSVACVRWWCGAAQSTSVFPSVHSVTRHYLLSQKWMQGHWIGHPNQFFSHPPLPPADVSEDTAQLAVRVRAAAAFMARLDEALKGKLGLEEVAALLAEVRGRRCKWAS